MRQAECIVVKVGALNKHPNADLLSITKVFEYPVVVRTEEWQPGDLGVFVPEDSVVPFLPEYDYVHKGLDDQRHRRVRAVRLRNVYSEGLLVKAPVGAVEGDEVSEILGITKYQPLYELGVKVGEISKYFNLKREIIRAGFVEYSKFPTIRRVGYDFFAPDDYVEIEEKIHGANARYGKLLVTNVLPLGSPWYTKAWYELKKLLGVSPAKVVRDIVGSHHAIKGLRTHAGISDWYVAAGKPGNWWGRVAKLYDVFSKLTEGEVLFGEVYGTGVQYLNYGTIPGEVKFRAFDLLNTKTGEYIDTRSRRALLISRGFEVPPLIFTGTFATAQELFGKELEGACQGKSRILGANHIREGVVVRKVDQRVSLSPAFERKIAKYFNPDYQVTKEPDMNES